MDNNQRLDRADQVATERRRRDGAAVGPTPKLYVPEHIQAELAAQNRTARWVNDVHNRIHDLTTRDDYDKVEGVQPVKVGTGDDGKPMYAHLLSKRNDFIAEDRAKSDQRRRQIEDARFKPSTEGEAPDFAGQLGASTYVDPATKIGRANQVLE